MTLQLVQISDTHISTDAPERLRDLENCIHAINDLTTEPDLVVHTGDIAHNGTPEEYHSARLLLDRLNAPYFVMAGNRDNRENLLSEFEVCVDRLTHLESMLNENTSKATAVFLHHPPYEAVGIPDPYQYEQWQNVDDLAELLGNYSNICGMFCGHVHRFIDGSIAGIEASAISCLAGDLRKGDVKDEDRKLPIFKSLQLPV